MKINVRIDKNQSVIKSFTILYNNKDAAHQQS